MKNKEEKKAAHIEENPKARITTLNHHLTASFVLWPSNLSTSTSFLFGAHEIQRFNRDADETVAWITEKDVVLSSDEL